MRLLLIVRVRDGGSVKASCARSPWAGRAAASAAVPVVTPRARWWACRAAVLRSSAAGLDGCLAGSCSRAVAAEAVERQDRADALADRLLARHAVGVGGAFLELQDLGGHRGGELLPPASPWQRLVVEQQQRSGGVALQTAGLDVRFEV